ncbi:MAG TPA: methyltransferase domain-containing protein [Candidatus Acidoferrales bacterium]|nr:methyltransferase domain-containing protein [Candidatus Acidoferrales bacterium]
MTQSKEPAAKENISSEREFFDKYYREHRGRTDPLESIWIAKATNPIARPLDYWEYTFHLVGTLDGKRALEVGCGGGWLTQMLALKGAVVSAIDVSEEGCVSTKLKLESKGLRYESICVMDGHAMTFPDESFDIVFMAGVLHHVNIPRVLAEVRRVLKPHGKIVCYEPLRYGRLMRSLKQVWLRARGLKDYNHTEHEEALTDEDLAPFWQLFEKGFVRKFNFLAKTDRLKNRFGRIAQLLRWTDYVLLSTVPPLRRYCTCAVCCFEK